MTKDERYLCEEFDMDDICKKNLKTYMRLYDAVTLMASNYDCQITALPQCINIPDEIALVFDDEVIAVMDNMQENGILSLENCEMIKKIQNRLLEMTQDVRLWTLEALKQSNAWEECRKDAKLLLASLYQLR